MGALPGLPCLGLDPVLLPGLRFAHSPRLLRFSLTRLQRLRELLGWRQCLRLGSFERRDGDRRQGEVAARACGGVLEWLGAVHETTTWTTSVCTGSLILAAAGLLEGKRATSHWLALEELRRLGALPVSERVVFDGIPFSVDISDLRPIALYVTVNVDLDDFIGREETVFDALPQAVLVNRITKISIRVSALGPKRRRSHAQLVSWFEVLEDRAP